MGWMKPLWRQVEIFLLLFMIMVGGEGLVGFP